MEVEVVAQVAAGRAKGHSCEIGMGNTECRVGRSVLPNLGFRVNDKKLLGSSAPLLPGHLIRRDECVHKVLGDSALQHPGIGGPIQKLATRRTTLAGLTKDRDLRARNEAQ